MVNAFVIQTTTYVYNVRHKQTSKKNDANFSYKTNGNKYNNYDIIV